MRCRCSLLIVSKSPPHPRDIQPFFSRPHLRGSCPPNCLPLALASHLSHFRGLTCPANAVLTLLAELTGLNHVGDLQCYKVEMEQRTRSPKKHDVRSFPCPDEAMQAPPVSSSHHASQSSRASPEKAPKDPSTLRWWERFARASVKSKARLIFHTSTHARPNPCHCGLWRQQKLDFSPLLRHRNHPHDTPVQC